MASGEDEVEVELDVPFKEVEELGLPERRICELVDVVCVPEVLLAIIEAISNIVVDPNISASVLNYLTLRTRGIATRVLSYLQKKPAHLML